MDSVTMLSDNINALGREKDAYNIEKAKKYEDEKLETD